MILAVCADKGSPGVTTTALAVAMAWPRPAVLLEADAAGGDLAFWGRRPDDPATAAAGGSLLHPEPSLLTLAADARTGLPGGAFPRYTQPTRWGIDVIPAPPAAQAFTPLRSLWDGVTEQAATWPQVVVTDLGRFHGASAAAPLARAASAVLLVTTCTVEGLYHARDRIHELVAALADPARRHSPVGVVVRAPRRQAGAVEDQVSAMLAAAGSPVPVVGSIWDDPTTVACLRAGQSAPRRRRRPGDLAVSAARLVEGICRRWPDLAPPAPDPGAASAVLRPGTPPVGVAR